MKKTTIMLYHFSIVGKWHQNALCVGGPMIGTKGVSVSEFVAMDEKGEICRRCKGRTRRA